MSDKKIAVDVGAMLVNDLRAEHDELTRRMSLVSSGVYAGQPILRIQYYLNEAANALDAANKRIEELERFQCANMQTSGSNSGKCRLIDAPPTNKITEERLAAMRELTTLAWELSEEPEQLAKAYEHVGDLCDALVASQARCGELDLALVGERKTTKFWQTRCDQATIDTANATIAELKKKVKRVHTGWKAIHDKDTDGDAVTIAELRAEVERLQGDGSPTAMAKGLFDLAEELGDSKFSSRLPALFIREHVADLKRKLGEAEKAGFVAEKRSGKYPCSANCCCEYHKAFTQRAEAQRGYTAEHDRANSLTAEVERLRPIAAQMAWEDCESYCGEACEEGKDEAFDPDTACWPTRARAALESSKGGA